MNSDIVIVGGGIIGLYSAMLLAEHNLTITLIDQGPIGKESSWAAGGILSPLLPWNYDDKTLYLTEDSSSKYAFLAETLIETTGVDIEYWSCGLVSICHEKHSTLKNWCASKGLRFSSKCPSDIDMFKSLQKKLPIYLPDVAQVRSPKLISALYKHLINQNVNLLPYTKLIDLKIENKGIVGAQTSAGLIKTNRLVWATGAWAGINSPSLNNLPPISPVRGQIIVFDGKSINLRTILYKQGYYLIPRKDGLILSGSTLENVGFDKSTTPAGYDELMQKSISLIPELKSCKVVHHWSGLRPYSKNQHPFIEQHPRIQGLYLNCGHYRYGVAMAPRSAEIISETIINPNSADLIKYYAMD
ncbi:MAG: FAD-dependent oxidoreductase [Pseudomonadota bacterium]